MQLQEKQAALKEELAWHVEQRARERSGTAAAIADTRNDDPPGASSGRMSSLTQADLHTSCDVVNLSVCALAMQFALSSR